MSAVSEIRGTVFLADWAEVVIGKLYGQGIGWTNAIADRPMQFAIACLIIVPYDETNKKHSGKIQLVTDDGYGYPSDNPLEAGFDFEVGRPPGMRPGEEQTVPFAVKIGGMQFAAGGYRVELYVDQQLTDTVSFAAKPG